MRDEVAAIARELHARGLLTGVGGNVSARVAPGVAEAWITPRQVWKGGLVPEMLVRIGLDGEPLDQGPGDAGPGAAAVVASAPVRHDGSSPGPPVELAPSPPGRYVPSSERRFHAAILRARPDVGAVVHGHAPHATALVLAGLFVVPVTTESCFLGDVPVLPYLPPGSAELALAVGEAFAVPGVVAVLLQNHGFITVGKAVREAANLAEILEHTAHLLITCRLLGRDPPVLDARAVADVRRSYG